jgi:hypothetical protein
MPSNSSFFRRFLRAESTAAMPATEEEVDELFKKYHIRSDHDACRTKSKNNWKPTSARLELAAAVLWFHTHVNEPEPALTRLPFEMQELLGECFVPDFAYFKGENHNWPSKLAHFRVSRLFSCCCCLYAARYSGEGGVRRLTRREGLRRGGSDFH